MALSGFASVWHRRTVVTLALVAGLAMGSNVWAQAAPADDFKFSSESAGIIWTIKGDKVADFESVWAGIRTKLAASDNPELKALGESFRIYKVDVTPVPADGQTYFFIADPASKTTTYSVVWLLYESKLYTRAEAEVLFPKIKDAIVQVNAIPFKKLQ